VLKLETYFNIIKHVPEIAILFLSTP